MAGKLIIISGPSGVGKGSIINGLHTTHPQLPVTISATTRPARSHEVHGKDYFFLSDTRFDEHIKTNQFLEWCTVHQYRYGTLRSQIDPIIENNQYILLEIDVQGAAKIHKIIPENCVRLFIAPPHISTLSTRLNKRNTDTPNTIKKRLKVAKEELKEQDHYDYVIVNNILEDAIKSVGSIIDEIKRT